MKLLVKFLVGIAVAASLAWLIGYCRVLSPLAWDHLREGEFDFLTFPGIKIYRLVDENTGAVSRHLDLFNTADGPTGVEYTERYFPCWPVSIAALCAFFGGLVYLTQSTADSRAKIQ